MIRFYWNRNVPAVERLKENMQFSLAERVTVVYSCRRWWLTDKRGAPDSMTRPVQRPTQPEAPDGQQTASHRPDEINANKQFRNT